METLPWLATAMFSAGDGKQAYAFAIRSGQVVLLPVLDDVSAPLLKVGRPIDRDAETALLVDLPCPFLRGAAPFGTHRGSQHCPVSFVFPVELVAARAREVDRRTLQKSGSVHLVTRASQALRQAGPARGSTAAMTGQPESGVSFANPPRALAHRMHLNPISRSWATKSADDEVPCFEPHRHCKIE